MSVLMIFGGVAVFAVGVAVAWLIAHSALQRHRKALKIISAKNSSLAECIGELAKQIGEAKAYAGELEQTDQQRKKELAIAIESSDRWRNEAFETQNKLSDVTNQLATEKRRAAALLGWNRIYRRTKDE